MLLKDKAWYATVIIISSEKIKEKGKKNKQQQAIILCKKFIYKHWKCTHENHMDYVLILENLNFVSQEINP